MSEGKQEARILCAEPLDSVGRWICLLPAGHAGPHSSRQANQPQGKAQPPCTCTYDGPTTDSTNCERHGWEVHEIIRCHKLIAELEGKAQPDSGEMGLLTALVRELILHYDEWVASDDSDFGSGNVDKAVEDLRKAVNNPPSQHEGALREALSAISLSFKDGVQRGKAEGAREMAERAAIWCEQQTGDFAQYFTAENAAQVIRSLASAAPPLSKEAIKRLADDMVKMEPLDNLFALIEEMPHHLEAYETDKRESQHVPKCFKCRLERAWASLEMPQEKLDQEGKNK